jgi:hypothetical protein
LGSHPGGTPNGVPPGAPATTPWATGGIEDTAPERALQMIGGTELGSRRVTSGATFG